MSGSRSSTESSFVLGIAGEGADDAVRPTRPSTTMPTSDAGASGCASPRCAFGGWPGRRSPAAASLRTAARAVAWRRRAARSRGIGADGLARRRQRLAGWRWRRAIGRPVVRPAVHAGPGAASAGRAAVPGLGGGPRPRGRRVEWPGGRRRAGCVVGPQVDTRRAGRPPGPGRPSGPSAAASWVTLDAHGEGRPVAISAVTSRRRRRAGGRG